MRILIVCTGTLLVMVGMLYLALGRGEHPSESGHRLGGASDTVASFAASFFSSFAANAPVRG